MAHSWKYLRSLNASCFCLISELIQDPNPYIFDKISRFTLTFRVDRTAPIGHTWTYTFNLEGGTTSPLLPCQENNLRLPSCTYIPMSLSEVKTRIRAAYFEYDPSGGITGFEREIVPKVQCK